MTINTTLTSLSQTAANNGPDGAVDAPSTLDDAIRYHGAFIAKIRDDAVAFGLTTASGTATATPAELQAARETFGGVLPGTLIMWGGSSLPTGYLACPAVLTNISRTTYAALFSAIGTAWGAGDGSTTFGMPFFPTGFAPIASTAAGGTSAGLIQDHTHPISAPNAATSVGGTVAGNTGNTGAIQSVTGNNLAAGSYVRMCIKY